MSYTFLETPIEYLKGVGPKRAEVLKKEAAVYSFHDLLTYYPFRYIDKSKLYLIKDIKSDAAYVQLQGEIRDTQMIGGGRAKRMTAYLYDPSGRIELVWFKGFKWLKGKFIPGITYTVFGKPSVFNNKFNIAHPEVEEAENTQSTFNEKFQAVYSTTEKLKSIGLGSKGFNKIFRNLITSSKQNIPENLIPQIIDQYKFLSRQESLREIHFPTSPNTLGKAQARLKFEELFYIQLNLLKQKYIRTEKVKGHKFPLVGDYFNRFYKELLPFELTNDQKKVIKEIRGDLGKGAQMNRLLQGDVGSGKTLVALMSMLLALDNGFQACFMAPTEILANQHFDTFSRMLGGLGIKIKLLTGSSKANVRKEIHKELIEGALQILIGTHALIEEGVRFKKLGLVVIDEQHRFGVAQRAKLWKKNVIPPHVLVMTATPIPRTLAMTLYGDLDVSVIRQLPPGRKPIRTYHYYDTNRLKIFGFIRNEIKKGRQVYIVYPLIKESAKLDLNDLMDGYESIVREFPPPKYQISIVHGQMKTENKDYEMNTFVKGESQIMVATTVIEVGVDVPNASVMLIENAERFGLSQLHQLRGRVGRGADQSYCLLISKHKLSNEARTRLQTMVETNDGFKIAEVDLRLRGPGEMEGTRQSGLVNLKLADLTRDEKILKAARQTAINILEQDPSLRNNHYQKMSNYLNFTNKQLKNWSRIS